MVEAYDKTTNKIISLNEYVAQKKQNPENMLTVPYCLGCGQAVREKNVAQSWDAATYIFEHADFLKGLNCPALFKHDPQFSVLAKYQYDARGGQETKAILEMPEIAELNKKELKTYYKLLTNREIKESYAAELWASVAQKKIHNMVILRKNPGLLPVLLAKTFKNVWAYNGAQQDRAFLKTTKTKNLKYMDFDGNPQKAQAPCEMQVFTEKKNKHIPLARDNQFIIISVQEAATHALAKMEKTGVTLDKRMNMPVQGLQQLMFV